MSQLDALRNGIIEKLMAISNKEYLAALYQLVDSSKLENEAIQLTDEQLLMLRLSDQDIQENKLISQEELNKSTSKWLKEL